MNKPIHLFVMNDAGIPVVLTPASLQLPFTGLAARGFADARRRLVHGSRPTAA